MYIFGGKNGSESTNKLYVLKVGIKNIEWIEIKPLGSMPVKRHGHTMNFYPNKKILIVFGGKTNEIENE